MKTTAEYLEKAEAFDQLARIASDELLRATYHDLAIAYRTLAAERRNLLDNIASFGQAKAPEVPGPAK